MNLLVRYALCALLALVAPSVVAAPPQTINYQGALTTAGGMPVNGAVVMTFRLYSVASGGNALYTETQLSVPVSNGSFNAQIGAVSPLNLPFDVPYWLGVQINADAEMSPRQPLSSSAYAFRASSLDGTATISGTQISGNVSGADFASSAGSANVATTSMVSLGLMGFLPGSQVSGAITAATIPATQVTGTLAGAQFAATQRLPTVACAVNEVAQWNGAAWVCAANGGSGSIAGNLTLTDSTSPSSGNMLKGGVRFLHNFGFNSTYLGVGAGNFTMTGVGNTAIGANALSANTSGFANSAFGIDALITNTSGTNNTALGQDALRGVTTGTGNIGIGTGGGFLLTVGSSNIAIGNAGLATDNNVIRIGENQARTFIAGIRGKTPGNPDALPVVIDSSGQLGTATAVGGVTSITAGAGLTGGTITGAGTIAIDPASSTLTTSFARLGGNSTMAPAILGTLGNQPVQIIANGLPAIRIMPDASGPNIALGDSSNVAGGGATFAATVSGGIGNRSSGFFAAVGGGATNTASGGASFVGGGEGNVASATWASVLGGAQNVASADYAMALGGLGSRAAGYMSLAAGQSADARNKGCFVWADTSSPAAFQCTIDDAFMVRASGGVHFVSNTGSGCIIAAGGGAWSCTSSRETKQDFAAMNPLEVLKRVAALPVSQWRYRTEASGARHVGPMAEDFHAAFGLGDSDKTINVIDASGIALAAIQGLNQLVEKKDAEIQSQSARINALEQALAAIRARLEVR